MNILVANVGSTSFKYKLFDMRDETVRAQGKIERIGSATAIISHNSIGKSSFRKTEKIEDYTAAIHAAIELITDQDYGTLENLSQIAAVGFKTVIAKNINGTMLLDDRVLAAMEEYIPVAPSHNPPYINAIRSFHNLCPGIPLIGLFEPTFHSTIPDYAYQLGVPEKWVNDYGIRKYGFHGASHRYIVERMRQLLQTNLKLVSCHLGGSSSLCAIKNGKSIDTSMTFSPQSGIFHANRIGDLDPFAVLYVMDKEKMTIDQMRNVLCKESGLTGISGIKGGDMRDIEIAADQGNYLARLAIKAFAYGIQKYIGAYLVALGGIDVVVFTGGIGENSAVIREEVCAGLSFLGIRMNEQKNQVVQGEVPIHATDSIAQIWVIPTNEELIVARETMQYLKYKSKIA